MIYFFSVLIFLSFSANVSAVLADSNKVTVVRVLDGDTVTISIGNDTANVRLANIDAPELSQKYGKESQQYLSEMVLGKTVYIEIEGVGKYGRILGNIKTLDGVDASLALLQNGLVWVYRKYCDDANLLSAEYSARKRRVGLWNSDTVPLPPWIYRHPNKDENVAIDTVCNSFKTRCSQMLNCKEAMFYLMKCGNISLDQDADFIPCQGLCAHR
jgi:micrococcal nuclease